MSTLGDPLTDIGMMFVYWPQAGEERASTMSPVTTLPGFPTRVEIAERYAQRTGADLSDLNWYVGFAFFKFAAIIAGIVARSAAGAMAGKDTAGYADRIAPCVDLGRPALAAGAISAPFPALTSWRPAPSGTPPARAPSPGASRLEADRRV